MRRLIINTPTGKVEGKIPTKFEELSVKQFLVLESDHSELELLSVLSGLDLSFLENTDTDLSNAINETYHLLNQKPPDLSKAPKKPITLEGKKIKFPESLDFTRYGQKSMVKNLIQNEEQLEKIIAEVFAIYAQPLLDGKFESNQIPRVKRLVEDLPIIEVFPYAVFFFKKLRELKIRSQIV